MNKFGIILASFFLICTSPPYFAPGIIQEQRSSKVAQKIDAYGFGFGEGYAHSADAINGHLANLAYFLRDEPSSRGYMIYYKGKNKNYRRNHPFSLESQFLELTAYLGIDKKRVIAINGGCRAEPIMELWIVPEDAAAPKPTPTCSKRHKHN